MWNRYFGSTANEATTPQTFRASDYAVKLHNEEVRKLEIEVLRLRKENDDLRKKIKEQS